jgi:adenosylmethionine-8-amino-7-oxononanoate aminotransferase
MNPLAQLDHKHVWHPFTQMRDWLKREPIVLVKGKGAVVTDVHGKQYIDANSSIWTNLHGHNHPVLNRAVNAQLKKVAHTSALGFANEPASLLAAELVGVTNPPPVKSQKRKLEKVFFSDDGSTAMEVALKLAYEFTRRSGRARRPKFLSLRGAYHGDTVGAVSLGHIDLFHKAYSGLLFKSDSVPAPYCYRCPHNRAKPERADAREYRQCKMECLDKVDRALARKKKQGEPYAGLVFEPLMQGAAGMIAQPEGWLKRATSMARAHGALLIADEVMTGFGRTGLRGSSPDRLKAELHTSSLFASHKEGVQPDLLACAKGLTGGYLPMAATLTTQQIFDAFLGEYKQFKTFFHGHSYTGNQIGAAVSLANLGLLERRESINMRTALERTLNEQLQRLWDLPKVGDIRRVGLIAGVELVKNWRTREAFPLEARAGIRVCEHMANAGVLTRPVGNVIVLMPAFCTTSAQIEKTMDALIAAIKTVLQN